MRNNRRRNWFIKRIALGFAVAAFVAPVAQAKVDEGIQGQLNTAGANVKPIPYRWPSSADKLIKSSGPLPHDPALGTPSPHDPAMFVGTQPRGAAPALVASRFGRPNATASTELEAVNWKDAVIGAGFAVGLVLLGFGAALASRHGGRAQTA
jgi:hypothetical protein